MSVRVKSRRRLAIILSAFVAMTGMMAGAYFYRMHRIEQRAQRGLVAGRAALTAGRYFDALQGIGTYIQRHEDAQALYEYGQARSRVEEPNHKHLIEAIAFYNRALSRGPANPQLIRRDLLALYVKMGFNTEAVNTADIQLKTDPSDLEAIRAKAIAYYRLRRYKESFTEAQNHNRLAPTDLEIQLLTLDLMRRQGQKPEQVLSYVQGLRKTRQDDPRLIFLESSALFDSGDAAKGLADLRTAAAAPLSDPFFAQQLTGQFDRLGRFDESLQVLQKGVGPGSDISMRRELAWRLWQAGRKQEALASIGAINPDDPTSDSELLGLRATALMDGGQQAEARQLIEKLRARRGDGVAAAWSSTLPIIYPEKPVEDKTAISTLRAAISVIPTNPYFHFALGDTFERAGDYETAADEFRLASSYAPAWTTPLVRASRMFAKVGRLEQAIDAANAAQLRAPTSVEAMIALALAEDPLVRTAEGPYAARLLKIIDDVQQQVSFEPRTLPVQVRLMALKGDKAGAMARVRAGLEKKPPLDEQTLLSLAVVCQRAQLGMEQSVLDQCSQVNGITPAFALTRATLAHEKGQDEKALRELEAAVQAHAVGDATAWQLTLARYLGLVGDSRALATWKNLAEQHSGDSKIQWAALGARAVQSDHEFIGRTIDRLRANTGEEGLSLKLARATWLLQSGDQQRSLADAAILLNDVCRIAPDLVAPHLLLASCLERMGNRSGAVEQLTIASNLRPNFTAVNLDLARLLSAQGDQKKAAPYLARVAAAPLLQPAERRRLAELFARAGQFNDAVNTMLGDPQSPPVADLFLASLYVQNHQIDKAREVYEELLKKPDAATISTAIDFYLAQNDPAAAQKALGVLNGLQLPPGNKELVTADYYRRINNLPEAIRYSSAATQAAPQNATAWRQLVMCDLAAGRTDQAISAAGSAAKELPSARVFTTIAQNGGLVKEFAADPLARPLVASLVSPISDEALADDIAALRVLSESKRTRATLTQTIAKLRPIADARPQLLALQTLLITLYAGEGQVNDVIAIGNRTMQNFPRESEPARLTAEFLATAGRWADASLAAQKWKERAPQEAMSADRILAGSSLAQKQPIQAMEILKPYLSACLASPEVEANLRVLATYALAQVLSGAPDEAAALLDPLMKLPRYRQLRIEMALRSFADAQLSAKWLRDVGGRIPQDSFAEAVEIATAWDLLRARHAGFEADAADALNHAELLSKSPTRTSAGSLVGLAMIKEHVGEVPAAEQLYRQALQLDPGQTVALNNLAMILVNRHGDLSEAAKLIADAIARQPEIPNFYDTRASILSASGDYPHAIENMNVALRLQPANPAFEVNLASIYVAKGDAPKAKALLDKVTATASPSGGLSEDLRQRIQALRNSLPGKV